MLLNQVDIRPWSGPLLGFCAKKITHAKLRWFGIVRGRLGAAVTASTHQTVNVVRGGLNYHFW